MDKLQIALLYGGKSTEHAVSLRSAYTVLANIDPDVFDVVLIGISTAGIWYVQEPVLPDEQELSIAIHEDRIVSAVPGRGFMVDGVVLPVHAAFPVLHGSYGEDGTVQGLLELAGIPYAGAGVSGSSIGIDKGLTKNMWEQAGLPVVPCVKVRKAEWCDEKAKLILVDKMKQLGFPLFIKPNRGGSSVGVYKVVNEAGLNDAVEKALRFDCNVLAEKAVNGRELELSVIGNDSVEVFGPGEILPEHEFYDYDAKYIDSDGALLNIPARIDDMLAGKVRELGKKAYRAADCRGFARVDFFLENETDKIMLNEINTLPGFTSISMFPLLCQHAGLSITNLITRLIESGIEYAKKQSRLKTTMS